MAKMTKAELESKVSYLEALLEAASPGAKDEAGNATTGPADRFRLGLTVALGVAIPLLSLAMSNIAGKLAGEGMWALALLGSAVGAAVLGVSLAHLAWAIGDVTRSGPRSSWALAVALDCSLVLCELVSVYAPLGLGLGLVCGAVMTAVCCFSMLLNCHAFLSHR